ncbi:MAG: hypothetical protein PWQ17_1205, partial [Anaerophaga sp.]|nr:hypothetical protein [Anaerophaga sp.]
SGPDGFSSTAQNPSVTNVTLANAGDYDVVVTDDNGCPVTGTTNVVINELPTVTLDDASTCDGQDITLIASSSGGSGNYVNYVWYNGVGNVIASGASNQLTLTGTDVELTNDGAAYSVTVEDNNGCISAPDDMILTVNENPIVIIYPGDPEMNICAGNDLVLDANATGGSGSYSYLWELPDGSTMTGQQITIPAVTVSNDDGVYTVTVTDGVSCSGTAQIDVHVIELTATLSASTTAVCENNKEITFTAGGGEQYEFFRYDSNAGTWSSVQGPDANDVYVTDQLNDGDQVYVHVFGSGCDDISDTIDITVRENPTISFNPGNLTEVCEEEQIVIMVQASGGDGNYTYEWYQDGTLIPGVSTHSYTINNASLFNAGNYEVIAIDDNGNGCPSNAIDEDVVVHPLPAVDLVADPPSALEGTEVTFTANGSGGDTFKFFINDDEKQYGTSNTFTTNALADGDSVSVQVFSSFECRTDDYLIMSVYEGVDLPIVVGVNKEYCEGTGGATVEVTNPQLDITYEIVLEDESATAYSSIIYDGTNQVIWNNVLDADPPNGTNYRVKAYRAAVPSEYELSESFEITEHPRPDVYTMTVDGSPVSLPDGDTASDCNAGTGYVIGLENSWGADTYELVFNGSQVLETKPGGVIPFVFDNSYSYVGTYTIRAIAGFGCSAMMEGSFTIEGDELQLFDLQTENDGRYCEDDPDGVELSLSGSESGVEYIVLQDGSPVDTITGNGNALVLGNYQQVGSEATTYSVVAYSSGGCPYLMNNSIDVEEVTLPDAGNLAVSNGGHYCEGGQGVHLTLENQEEGLTYYLIYESNNTVAVHHGVSGGGNVNFVNDTDGTEWFTSEGDYYVISETNDLGCVSSESNSVTVETDPLPEDRPILGELGFCPGGGTNLYIEDSQNDVEYQLFDVVDDVSYGSAVSGNGSTLSFAVTDSSSYTILATNTSTGCVRNFEDTVKVVEYDVPDATLSMVVDSVVISGNPCAPKEAIVSIENPEEGVTYYLWREGNSSYSSFVEVTQAGLSEVEFPDAIIDRNGHYYITAIGNSGCEVRLLDEEDIHIEGAISVFGLNGGANLCQGDGATTVSTTGSETSVTYSLIYVSNGHVYDIQPGNGYPIDFVPDVSSNSYFYLEADNGSGCKMVMDSLRVKFNPLPKAFEMTGSGVYCDMSVGGAQVGLNGSEFGVDYFLLEENTGQADVEEGRYDGGPLTFNVLVPNGTYTVFAKNQTTGCTSSMKDTVRVIYEDTPPQPNFVTNPVISCGQEYTEIEIDNAVSGVDYELVNISNVDSVIIARKATINGDFVISPVASGSYYVKASWGGSCDVISEQIDIETGEIVLPAQVEDYSMNYCYGEPISITAFIDSDHWTYELADENQSVLSHIYGSVGADNSITWTFDSTEVSQKYYVRVADGSGFCGEEYSSEISVSVAQAVNPPVIASDTIFYCPEAFNKGTVIVENSSSDYAYYLYRSDDTSTYFRRLFGEDGNDIGFEYLDSAEYVISAIDLTSGCESEFDTVLVSPYSSPAYIDRYISDILLGINVTDTLYLGDNGLSIDVDNLESDLNYYLINEEEDTVEFDNSIGGTIDINEPGEYQLFVQYSDVSCEPVPYNGVLYVFEDMLEAHPAFIYLNENEVSDSVTVNVTKTDIDIDNLNFFFPESETNPYLYEGDFGIIQFKDQTTGFVEYTKAPSFFGVDTILYRVENLLEPSRWDQDTIFVYVGNKNMTEDRSIFIPNAFSPNGDGINDYFVISSNRSRTEESTFEVFNRWGTLVYRSQGKVYQNDWDGKSNINNMIAIGDDLPNGVYFYVYTVKANVDGETVIKKFNGFVELRR